jgi:hypothetical protein
MKEIAERRINGDVVIKRLNMSQLIERGRGSGRYTPFLY